MIKRSTHRLASSLCLLAVLITGSVQAGPAMTQALSRADYIERLRGMWLGESLANWTGLVTELQRNQPPFYTDDDWGTQNGNSAQNDGWIDFVIQDVWQADDDTDIEYIYLEAIVAAGQASLTPEQVRQAWVDHIEPASFIWVANRRSHDMMRETPYALPPEISFLAANDLSLMIDAQLTTEHFGSFAPGMPVLALQLGDIAIRNTASGYAAHAAQFYTAMYALAPVIPAALAPREQVLWLVEHARQLIPDTSKTADVIDFVLQDYLANADVDDWESTRDAVYQRYQLTDRANGFRYLSAFESAVNLAGGLIALLYGEGDYRRSVMVGTLSGWDSDNGTATIGGLLGLMLGVDGMNAAFPDNAPLSDEYNIHRTRINFPEGLDTFTAMATRQANIVEAEIIKAGGSVNGDEWILPAVDYTALSADQNPLAPLDASSANNLLARSGETPIVTWAGTAAVLSGPRGVNGSEIADGLEYDYSGMDRQIAPRAWEMSAGQFPAGFVFNEIVNKDRLYAAAQPAGGEVIAQVSWSTPIEIAGVRMVEGPYYFFLDDNDSVRGEGYFESVVAEAQVDGNWVTLPTELSKGVGSPDIHHELLEWSLPEPASATAVRVRGIPATGSSYVTIAELEGIVALPAQAPAPPPAEPLAEAADPSLTRGGGSIGGLLLLLLTGIGWTRRRTATG